METRDLDELFKTLPNIKTFIKRVEQATEGRLVGGEHFTNAKLVKKRASGRVWRDGADSKLIEIYGDGVYSHDLKSPAVIEKEFAGGKSVTAEWAYTPEVNDVTVVPMTDKRAAVTATKQSAANVFGGVALGSW